MAEQAFELEYDGPALTDHEMDARDFARAVLSAGDLFQEMNRTVYPASGQLSVNIRAVSPGSFGIFLKLLSDAEVGLLTSQVIAANNLAGLLNIFVGLLKFVGRRGRSTVVAQEEAAVGTIRLTFDDNETLEVPSQAIGLSESVTIRRNISEIVSPLNAEGVQTLRVRQEEMEIVRIEKADVPALQSAPVLADLAPSALPTTDREAWLVLVAVTFKKRNKWRFSDGDVTFGARISDAAFQARIDDGEPFRKNDRMRVILRETQWEDGRGELHSKREIMRVIEHAPTGTQARFDSH